MRIYMIGDSLTRGTFRNKGAYAYQGFATRLAGERDDIVVDGIDGITTSAWVQRYPQRGYAPDLAVVMLGTNDAAQSVRVEEFMENLKHLKAMIGGRVLILTPPPTLHDDINLLIDAYAAAIEENFPEECLNLTTLDIPRDGFFPDGVHLFTKGHDMIYQRVKEKLAELTCAPAR